MPCHRDSAFQVAIIADSKDCTAVLFLEGKSTTKKSIHHSRWPGSIISRLLDPVEHRKD